MANKINSEYYETEDINTPEVCRYLASLEPDIIFSTWPRLIHKCILDIPKYGYFLCCCFLTKKEITSYDHKSVNFQ